MQPAAKLTNKWLLLGAMTLLAGAPSAIAQETLAQENLPTLPPDNPATPTVDTAPVPFRPPVQPTQTQPAVPQPLPQPLAPTLPFNTSDPLKAGDILSITVLGFENLSGQQQVSSTGTVQLPLGGPIFVGGFTPLEATNTIEQALLPFVRRPEVSVNLLASSPLRISVSGEVLRPGPRLIEPINVAANSSTQSQQRRPPTLSTALIESGGITPSADLRNIVIRRAVPTRTAGAPAPYGEFRVNLWDAVSSGDLSADPQIFDGDEIIVPTAEVANIDQRTLLSSTVAPGEITVQVAGEVFKPGQLTVSPTIGVSGAVAAAGGPTTDADTDEVTLLRMMPDGSVDQISYAFGDASEPLIEGDVVFVEPSSRGNVGDVFDFVGRILNPFGQLFNIFDD